MRKILRIVSRNSELALWQANYVKSLILQQNPDIAVEIIGITTKGDQILDRSLDKIGGKGLFIKELENYLLDDMADIAVHSAKDLPAHTPDGLCIGGFLAREQANDVLLSNKYNSIEDMPDGSIIGTSSSRRSAILREYYPKLQIKLLRGNLNTRVNKLDNGEYDAIILAQAGVVRLGWGDRIKQQLPLDIFIPAIGQGALAIELRDDSKWQDVISRLYCTQTSTEVSFERKVGAYLNADCSTPLGCFVVEHNGNYQVSAFIRLDNKPYKKLEYIYHDGNSDELHSLITSTLC